MLLWYGVWIGAAEQYRKGQWFTHSCPNPGQGTLAIVYAAKVAVLPSEAAIKAVPLRCVLYFRNGGTFALRVPRRQRHAASPLQAHRTPRRSRAAGDGALVIRGPYTGSAGALRGIVAARVGVLLGTAKVRVLGRTRLADAQCHREVSP